MQSTTVSVWKSNRTCQLNIILYVWTGSALFRSIVVPVMKTIIYSVFYPLWRNFIFEYKELCIRFLKIYLNILSILFPGTGNSY